MFEGGQTTRPTLADQIVARAGWVHARVLMARFMRSVRRGRRAQERVLLQKLRRCADSTYGQDFGFAKIQRYRDFAAQVPIQTYEDVKPYVERVKRGQTDAMFGPSEKVLMFALTSGTAGDEKYIPVTQSFLAEYRRGWNTFGLKALMDHPGTLLRPILQITSPMDEFHTEGGIPCGAITGLMAATQKAIVRKYYVAPLSVAYIPEIEAKYYTLLRLGIPKDVAFLITASPATQLQLARTADAYRDDLIRDIHDGTLTDRWKIPGEIRQDLTSRLEPRPDLAQELEKLVSTYGALRPKDFWRLGFLCNWTGGTMGLYLRDYPTHFGPTPVRDLGLLATEGRISMPIADKTAAGILEIESHFYEFIPRAEWGANHPVTLRSHQVQVGQEYFVLLTTSSGLYRYDIGDLVRVTAMIGDTPMIEFLNRGIHVSSLSGEKLTEHQVVLAMEEVCKKNGWSVSNFLMTPTWGTPPRYTVHLDRPIGQGERTLTVLATLLDEALSRVNIEYASKRKTGRLAPVVARLLPTGTLDRLDDELRSKKRRGNEQYKHRYLYTSPEASQQLLASVIAG